MTVPGAGQEPNPQAGQEPSGSTPPPSSQTPPAAGQEPAPERYDAEYVKELRKSEAATRKKLQEAEAKVKEHEQAQLSEVERLAGSAKEAGEKLTAAEARARDLAIRLAVAETASTIGISGASVKAAVRLLDHGTLKFDEDTGEPTNVEEALKALVKEYPMLAVDGEKPPAAQKGTPSTPKPANGSPSREDTEQVRQKVIAQGNYPRF